MKKRTSTTICLPEAELARDCSETRPDAVSEPVLDAHIHLFDPRRACGIPWPTPEDGVLYQPALPERFAALAARLGVRAAIAVEASPLRADNDWLLELADSDPRIIGVVANLDPLEEDFASELSRLVRGDQMRKRRLLVGIRSGNLWRRDLALAVSAAETRDRVLDHLRLLADSGLALDVANPDFALLGAVLKIAECLPELRIIVDHLPAMVVAEAEQPRWRDCLAGLSKCGNVFAKLSEIPRLVDGRVLREAEFYRPMLETICSSLREDQLIFGSDWPNSDRWLPYETTFGLVWECMDGLSPQAQRGFFWSNGLRAYGRDGA